MPELSHHRAGFTSVDFICLNCVIAQVMAVALFFLQFLRLPLTCTMINLRRMEVKTWNFFFFISFVTDRLPIIPKVSLETKVLLALKIFTVFLFSSSMEHGQFSSYQNSHKITHLTVCLQCYERRTERKRSFGFCVLLPRSWVFESEIALCSIASFPPDDASVLCGAKRKRSYFLVGARVSTCIEASVCKWDCTIVHYLFRNGTRWQNKITSQNCIHIVMYMQIQLNMIYCSKLNFMVKSWRCEQSKCFSHRMCDPNHAQCFKIQIVINFPLDSATHTVLQCCRSRCK